MPPSVMAEQATDSNSAETDIPFVFEFDRCLQLSGLNDYHLRQYLPLSNIGTEQHISLRQTSALQQLEDSKENDNPPRVSGLPR